MVVKFELFSAKIPIEIGNMKFELDVSDEKYDAFTIVFNKYLDELTELTVQESEDLNIIKEKQRLVFTTLLGEGAFDAIYAMSPSIVSTTRVLNDVVNYMEQEVKKRLEGDSSTVQAGKQSVKKEALTMIENVEKG